MELIFETPVISTTIGIMQQQPNYIVLEFHYIRRQYGSTIKILRVWNANPINGLVNWLLSSTDGYYTVFLAGYFTR